MRITEVHVDDIIIADRQRRAAGNIDGLINSIRDVGLLHPIVVGTDMRLKVGYRRLLAFKQMGRTTIPAHVTDSLDDVYAALRAERDENIQRKALAPSEIVERAKELDAAERAAARERQATGWGDHSGCANFAQPEQGKARDKVAEAFGVSGFTYEKAKQVVEAAETEPDLFADLPEKMDAKSVDAAHKEMRKRKREKERQKVAEKAAKLPPDDRWQVEIADIRTYETSQRFDFIITDPPYPKEYLPLYGVLAERALQWLKPTGLVLAMCGESYLNRVMRLMDEHLTYYWIGCYLTPGEATSLRAKQVNTQWKPIVIYGLPKQKYGGKIFGDVWRSDANDKTFHKWGQSESGMLSMIQQVCLPGQSILDPFCGAGSTGVAALKHGCTFHGIDVDETSVGLAKARLAKAVKT